MKKTIIWAVVIVVIVLLGVWINSKNNSEAENFKIGVIAPLTGWAAYWGEDVKKAIDLATEEINNSGGINGKDVIVFYEDMGSIDLKQAASATNKLINIDDVDLIFTNFLEDTVVAAPITYDSNIPIISIGSGNNGVEPKDLLFRIRPYLEGISPEYSSKYFYNNGVNKPSILYEELPYYVNYKEETEKAWQENFGIQAKSFSVSGDVRSSVLKAINSGTDMIYLRASTPTQIELIKRIREISPEIKIEATEAQDPAIINSGQITDDIFYYDYKLNGDSDFEDNFTKKYSVVPVLPAKLAYDAIYSLRFALEDQGFSTKSIMKGLSKISFDGASGNVRFDENQNRVINPDQLQLYVKKSGKFEEVN